VRSRGILALFTCLLVGTCAYAESIYDPDMTTWRLIWYLGENSAFESRWWHGIGWPALVIGLPTALVVGLMTFGLNRAIRCLAGAGQHSPGMETDRDA